MGSFRGMSMDPVATAAGQSPMLTTLAKDIKEAGRTAELNSMRGFTVFLHQHRGQQAPRFLDDNDAQPGRARHDPQISRHWTAASPPPAWPASKLTTLVGGSLKPSKMGSVYEMNNADVICGNIQAANATVYIINEVLVPTHCSADRNRRPPQTPARPKISAAGSRSG
jgi:uncharacterized surface protein with fasciclin (FAS1) repeats